MSDYRQEPRADEPRDEPYAYEPYDLSVLRDYEPIHPESTWKSLAKKLFAPLLLLAVLVWKFKAALLAVFKFKFVGAALSMLVSIAAYAVIWGWMFAVGLVALLFVHEMGHVLEARRQGLPTSAPMFIPFVGALIALRQLPDDAWREARLALAGPIIGSLGAAAFWGIGAALDSDFFVAMAFVGFFLNLFNLLPIVPLDGGRAVAALHPGIWLVGLVALAGLLVVMPNPILILVLVIGGMELWNRWRERGSPGSRAYYAIAAWQRVAVGVVYVGLAAALVLAMSATHIERTL